MSAPRPPSSPADGALAATPASPTNVVALADRRRHLRRAALGRTLRTWAPRGLLILGAIAGLLLWDAGGRPSPLHILPAFRPPPEPSRIEGDVIDGRRILLFDGGTVGYGSDRFRIANIDAPDSGAPRCAGEKAAGERFKDRLAQLLRVERVAIRPGGRDADGNRLATLSVDGRDVGETLVAERLVLPRRDGPDATLARIRHWCG